MARPGRPASAGPVRAADQAVGRIGRGGPAGRGSAGRAGRAAHRRPAGRRSVQRVLEELVRLGGSLLDVRTGGELLEEVLQDAVTLDVGPLLGRRRELGVERGGDGGLAYTSSPERGGVLRVARDEAVLAEHVLELLA